nr:MAG TPA: hypothetical protein [Caudoviricetes sp.]
MKKLNSNSNPNYQKILTKISKNNTETKDLLDFNFLSDNGEKLTVNDLFDKILQLEEDNKNQKLINEKLTNTIEALSEQILRIHIDINNKISNIENKLDDYKYL